MHCESTVRAQETMEDIGLRSSIKFGIISSKFRDFDLYRVFKYNVHTSKKRIIERVQLANIPC